MKLTEKQKKYGKLFFKILFFIVKIPFYFAYYYLKFLTFLTNDDRTLEQKIRSRKEYERRKNAKPIVKF